MIVSLMFEGCWGSPRLEANAIRGKGLTSIHLSACLLRCPLVPMPSDCACKSEPEPNGLNAFDHGGMSGTVRSIEALFGIVFSASHTDRINCLGFPFRFPLLHSRDSDERAPVAKSWNGTRHS
jgi:hypothetical protein